MARALVTVHIHIHAADAASQLGLEVEGFDPLNQHLISGLISTNPEEQEGRLTSVQFSALSHQLVDIHFEAHIRTSEFYSVQF